MSTFDVKSFVTLGEGLAAGVGHFSLSEEIQPWSFPALVAGKISPSNPDEDSGFFRQPVIQAPGVGNVGFAHQPAIVPELLQTTVLNDFPRNVADLGNISVPGLSVADALNRRPSAPMVQPDDPNQTLVNLVLGVPGLTQEGGDLPTQVEYANSRNPDLVLVALGYQELLEPLVDSHIHGGRQADISNFAKDYEKLLGSVTSEGRKVVACTVPNPLDTAYFSNIKTAAHILRTEEDFLMEQYGLAADDLIDLRGLTDIGYEFTARQLSGEVPEGTVVTADRAKLIRKGVDAMNRSILETAVAGGAVVFDLHGLFAEIARDGAQVGDKHLTGDYLGGFYLLNGVFPGRTGHAIIANRLIDTLNREFHAGLGHVSTEEIAADDANTMSKVADGPTYTKEYLVPRTEDEVPPPPPGDPSMINVYPPFVPGKLNIIPIQTTYIDPPFDIGGRKAANDCVPKAGVPAGGMSNPHLKAPLKLPASREQTLTINKELSYFGDALRPVDAPNEVPFLPGLPTFGADGNTFFGGLAMTDSHLSGQITIRFGEPDENDDCRFEVTHPGGLRGEDGVLSAPKFFKLPNQCQRVTDVPGLLSTGQVNLKTGVVIDINYSTFFINSATATLGGVNPNLPGIPIMFPGAPNGGSTWARFDQREDGQLDFTFAGNTFLPLGMEFGGDPIRFPLPFGNPKLQCASIVTRGTVLHPHLHISTKASPPPIDPDLVPEIPINKVVEFTPFVRQNNFGDIFGLEIDEMGGKGTGRSHLMGRLRIQFGPRSGDTVAMALSYLPPGGLMSEDPVPLPYLPPGTSRGMIGFNEQLKFPLGVTYNQQGLSSAMDPNNLCISAVNVKTGQILDEFLCRSYVVQKLFVNLIDVEPCTPGDSFLYQGPARLVRGHDGELVFSFNGEVFIPYPKGFKFPRPTADGRDENGDAFDVVRPSILDPFLRIQANHRAAPATGRISSGGRGDAPNWIEETSSIGHDFTYRFNADLDSSQVFFEYTKRHAEGGGTFKLHHLAWLSATNSPNSTKGSGTADTVTFTGFGEWIPTDGSANGDKPHLVSVHISTSETEPYVGIMVDGGTTSNVNTKPPVIEDSIPDTGE
ncbi:MAG: hypothetical protein ACI8UO_005595 [Verrucomicrobiales bacterium]|jgi:hypothetical protein